MCGYLAAGQLSMVKPARQVDMYPVSILSLDYNEQLYKFDNGNQLLCLKRESIIDEAERDHITATE